jgi:hypothetical protein
MLALSLAPLRANDFSAAIPSSCMAAEPSRRQAALRSTSMEPGLAALSTLALCIWAAAQGDDQREQ